MAVKRAISLMIIVFLATSLAAAGYAISTIPFLTHSLSLTNPGVGLVSNLSQHQGITGNAIIANVSPLCTNSGSKPASGPNLIVTSAQGKILTLTLNWNLVDSCALVAQFFVPLSPGTYSVTLSPCNYMGCKVLPMTVVVHPGTFTPMTINIVTGIV